MTHKNAFNQFIASQSTGDFPVTIRDISKDKYLATTVKRSEKSIHQAIIEDLPDKPVLESVMEWRLISEQELAASESPVGTLVSQGTAQWNINRRSVPSGNYLVTFTVSIRVGDPASSETLKAFDYGFIKVIAAPLRAIIDGGSSVLWGSRDAVTVDGSLSYDGDVGPGNSSGLKFTWSCYRLGDNTSVSNNCFGSFKGDVTLTSIEIIPRGLKIRNPYVLRLTVSRDDRSHFAEIIFEIAAGEIPQVSLRYFKMIVLFYSSSLSVVFYTQSFRFVKPLRVHYKLLITVALFYLQPITRKAEAYVDLALSNVKCVRKLTSFVDHCCCYYCFLLRLKQNEI